MFNKLETSKHSLPAKVFDTLVETLVDGLIIIDQEGIIRAFNTGASRIFGYTGNEAIGKNVNIIMPANYTSKHQGFVEEYLSSRESTFMNRHPRELKARAKDGSNLIIEISVGALEVGDRQYFIGSIRDITERKKVEDQLALLAQESRDVILLHNKDAKVLYVSPAVERILGYTTNEYRNKKPFEFIHPDDLAHVLKAHDEHLLAKKTGEPVIYRMKKKNGPYIWVETVVRPVFHANGKIKNFVTGMREVSQRIEMEEQLRQAQKMEAIGQLTGGIAHDFNNLLTAITGSLAVLENSTNFQQTEKELLEIALKAARRGGSLTHRLLAFSRKQTLKPENVNSEAMLKDLEKLLPRVLRENISLDIVSPGAEDQVRVDPGELENCLINLAINARDAMPEGGELRIEAKTRKISQRFAQSRDIKPGTYVVFSVTDTGVGMSKEVIARAFDPFFTTKESGKGTGLGLSMVYGFARQSGGAVEIHSEVGTGTRVEIFIPLVREKKQKTRKALPTTPEIKPGGKTILLVEDDALVRRFVSMALKSKNYNMLLAEDGVEALRVMKGKKKIDLLLTDLVLPNALDGAEVGKAFQEKFPKGAVIYSSGYAENSILSKGRIPKGYAYLPKPYDLDDLLANVAGALFTQGG